MNRVFARLIILTFLAVTLTAPGDALSRQEKKPGKRQNSRTATAGAPQQQEGKIVLESKLVSVTVTVMDKLGRLVAGLDKDNFEIYDDGVKQEIAHFADDDAPLSLGIVYDVSGSMGDLTNQSLAWLKQFFETSHADDEYFIIAFNDRPKLVHDFTISPDDILSRVIFVKAKGNTALYDAVYLAAEKARQGRHSKKVLLVLSDGLENNSRYSGKELGNLLKESDVLIYTLGTSEFNEGSGVLKRLAGWSGGRAFFPATDYELGDIYTRMALLLRHQYVIGFYPTNTESGNRWHEVRVKLKVPRSLGRLALYYKKGYQSFR
ncbi:MAG: VWA domain-containing protein [Blastocatellia bacterium]|nr:VWA domain-containing protein [Blastocatellia bacterium]